MPIRIIICSQARTSLPGNIVHPHKQRFPGNGFSPGMNGIRIYPGILSCNSHPRENGNNPPCEKLRNCDQITSRPARSGFGHELGPTIGKSEISAAKVRVDRQSGKWGNCSVMDTQFVTRQVKIHVRRFARTIFFSYSKFLIRIFFCRRGAECF